MTAEVRAPNELVNIGLAVRRARTAKNLSLRAVAKRAGVTAGLLSQVETGRAKPSVDTLFAVATALDVPVAHLFLATPDGTAEDGPTTHTPTNRHIVKRAARRRLSLETGIVWESLTETEQPGIRLIELHYPPGARSVERILRHSGRDFLLVVEGEITVQLEFQNHLLETGDSMWFNSSIPHQLRNDSGAPARIISLTIDPWPPAGTES